MQGHDLKKKKKKTFREQVLETDLRFVRETCKVGVDISSWRWIRATLITCSALEVTTDWLCNCFKMAT